MALLLKDSVGRGLWVIHSCNSPLNMAHTCSAFSCNLPVMKRPFSELFELVIDSSCWMAERGRDGLKYHIVLLGGWSMLCLDMLEPFIK